MSVDTDFYSLLVATVNNSQIPVQQNVLSEDKTIQPRVWFQRRASNTNLLLNGTAAIVDTNYDVEVIGTDPDVVGTLADSLKSTLNGHRGTLGSSTCQAIFVNDADDDYIFQSIDLDSGLHVMAFGVRILQ